MYRISDTCDLQLLHGIKFEFFRGDDVIGKSCRRGKQDFGLFSNQCCMKNCIKYIIQTFFQSVFVDTVCILYFVVYVALVSQFEEYLRWPLKY